VGPGQFTCAMCHRGMPGDAVASRPVTGGICEECTEHLGAQGGVPLLDFLDTLGMPVLVSDSDVVVTRANKTLLSLLNKDLPQVSGHRGGEVFECAHSHLPGGCGKTIHCSGCAIRRSVTETFVTGKSFRNVEAYLDCDLISSLPRLRLLISTEKVLGVVLLQIDHVGRPESDLQS